MIPKFSYPILFFDRAHVRWVLRAFALLSTLVGFYYGFNLHEYAPFKRRAVDGLFWTSLAHAGLWLSTFDIRGPVRYLVVLFLIPSAIATPLLLGINLIFAGMIFVLNLWLMIRVTRRGYDSD